MIEIQLSDDELNTILHGLYVMEDQHWFRGHHLSTPLIRKLAAIQKSVADNTDKNVSNMQE